MAPTRLRFMDVGWREKKKKREMINWMNRPVSEMVGRVSCLTTSMSSNNYKRYTHLELGLFGLFWSFDFQM
jgi:hypothetical protein